MNPLVYGTCKFEVFSDRLWYHWQSLTDSFLLNTKMIPSYELPSNNNKMLLLTIQHYIEEVKQWIDDI